MRGEHRSARWHRALYSAEGGLRRPRAVNRCTGILQRFEGVLCGDSQRSIWGSSMFGSISGSGLPSLCVLQLTVAGPVQEPLNEQNSAKANRFSFIATLGLWAT